MDWLGELGSESERRLRAHSYFPASMASIPARVLFLAQAQRSWSGSFHRRHCPPGSKNANFQPVASVNWSTHLLGLRAGSAGGE